MNSHGLPLCFLFLIALSASPSRARAQTNTIVIPEGMATAFGDGYLEPFSNQYIQFQQIYGSNLFASLPSDRIIITQLAFRVDERNGNNMDAPVYGAALGLNMFRGSLQQIGELGSGYQFPVTKVFHKDTRIVGQVGITNRFDVQFPFETPFVYDRTFGHLVLAIGHEGVGGGPGLFDAKVNLGFDDGFAITFNQPQSRAYRQILVTEFTYLRPPEIKTIRILKNVVSIEIAHSGSLASIKLAASLLVYGPYLPVDETAFTALETGVARAAVSVSQTNRYFQVQQSFQ